MQLVEEPPERSGNRRIPAGITPVDLAAERPLHQSCHAVAPPLPSSQFLLLPPWLLRLDTRSLAWMFAKANAHLNLAGWRAHFLNSTRLAGLATFALMCRSRDLLLSLNAEFADGRIQHRARHLLKS